MREYQDRRDVENIYEKARNGTADFVRKYFKNTFMDDMNRYDIIECDGKIFTKEYVNGKF